MIGRVLAWYRARRRGTRILLVGAAAGLALAGLYVSARLVQYAGASRTPAALFVPEDPDVVVRIVDGAGRWRDLKGSDLWRIFTKKLQKDPSIRESLNEILGSYGAPTLDDLEDRRWLDRNPMLREESLLRFAGRDLAVAVTGEKFCVATRVGPMDYLLLPGLQLFPGLAGAAREETGGVSMLRRGKLFLSIQGAIVVVSNDAATLASALKRKGTAVVPKGLLRATIKAEPMVPALRAFPWGGLTVFADLDKSRSFEIEVEVAGPDLVVRMTCDGMEPLKAEPAPVDTVRMIPSNGLGSVVTNIETGRFWEWLQRVTDRRLRGGTAAEKFARENFRDLVEVLSSNGIAEEVIPKLDGPVSVLFGASEGEDGKTYAAFAVYMRTSQPREAAESLRVVIDKASQQPNERFKPSESEVAGIRVRSYRYQLDPLGFNNYLCPCFAVMGDGIILANNQRFLMDALRSLSNQEPGMAVQLHYEQALRRLQQLGLKKIMAPGAPESFFLYGPALRQGLEGFYGPAARYTTDTPAFRVRLKQDLETRALREGQPLTAKALDEQFDRVRRERERELEDKLRARARILDYLKWVAFQADTVPGGTKLELVVELK